MHLDIVNAVFLFIFLLEMGSKVFKRNVQFVSVNVAILNAFLLCVDTSSPSLQYTRSRGQGYIHIQGVETGRFRDQGWRRVG